VLIVQICAKPLPIPSAMGPVPEGFDAWFAKAASRDPADRFPSAKAMAVALREVIGASNGRMTQPSLLALPPPPEPSPQLTHPGVVAAIATPAIRRSVPAILAFAGGLIAVVVVGLVFIRRGNAPPRPTPPPMALASSAEAAPTGAPGVSSAERKPEVTPAQSIMPPPPAPSATEAAAPSATASASAKPISSAKPPLRVGGRPGGSRPGGYRPTDHLGF
jgi:hypothetical protein